MNKSLVAAVGSLVWSSFFLSACSGDDATMEPGSVQTRLDQQVEIWNQQNIERYDYEYRRSCFCPNRLNTMVSVENGQVVEAFYLEDGTYLEEEQLQQLYTVDELFAVIQGAIDDAVYSLDVEYHEALGYPTRIAIDRDEQVVDEEVTHYATDLQ